MERIASVGLALFMLTGTTSFADTNVNIQIDGKPMKNGAGAIIMENRTMVPFRAVFEELGADMIQWDKETKTITGVKGDTTIILSIGNNVCFVNGEPQTVEVPPVILNSSTLVPLSFISEKLGYHVGWHASSKTVKIMSEEYYLSVGSKEMDELKNVSSDTNQPPKPTPKPTPNPKPQDGPTEQTGQFSKELKGAFAMQNLSKAKFVAKLQNNGAFEIMNLASKKPVLGTYQVKGNQITFTSDILNGTFSIEKINGNRTYYMLKSSKGSALAITSISQEQYSSALK